MVIFANSYPDLVKKINVLNQQCRDNKLIVNIDKTKRLNFARRQSKKFNSINLNRELIDESVSTNNYRSVHFCSSGLFTQMVKKAISKSSSNIGTIINIRAKSKTNSWKVRIKLKKAIINTSLRYCAQVHKTLKKDHHKFLQKHFPYIKPSQIL